MRLTEPIPSSSKPFQKCLLCDIRVDSTIELVLHIQNKHPNELVDCLFEMLGEESEESERDVMKPRRPAHPVWSYFERIDRFDAICLLCKAKVKSACSTNLSRHICRHHPETAVAIKQSWKGRNVDAKSRMEVAGVNQMEVHPATSPSCSSAREPRESVVGEEGAEKVLRSVGGTGDGAAESATMNSGEGDSPACPVALHPYGMGAMGTMGPMGGMAQNGSLAMGGDLAGLGLGPTINLTGMDLGNSWCQFPAAYPDLRHLEHTNYETDLTLAYPDVSAVHKYDQMKYDYSDLRAKQFDESRLYHKEPEEATMVIKEEEKEGDDKSKEGDVTPAKRGRPTENPCWNYFIRLDDQNVRCRLCSKVVKSACATNMTKHLERHHQQDYQHLIVQIKQYRSQKGPVVSPSDPPVNGSACLLPTTNHFVKNEPYNDVYGTQFGNEQVLRNFNAYDRNTADPSIWQRAQWGQWQTGHDASTSAMDGNNRGVIMQNEGMASPSWQNPSPGASSGGEKPYMKRNRKTEHPVWEYFKRTQDGNAQCAICTGIVKSPCSSNFMRHLMRHHSAEYNNVYMKWVQKRGPNK